MDRPVIRLWLLDGLGLILLHKTGVRYSNQTGGHACLHPEVEGAFVPLAGGHAEHVMELSRYFTGPKWGCWCQDGIDEETADFIDRILKGCPEARRLRVDRSHLMDCHEAWVYVEVLPPAQEEHGLELFDRFTSARGILTWPNSD